MPWLERYIKYNEASSGYRTLTIIYANIGRKQKARSMLEKATKGYPPTMKNVRFMMAMYPLKDLKVMQRIAAPMLGGMITAPLVSMVLIPVLYVMWRGHQIKRNNHKNISF